MATQIGVGVSTKLDSFSAGRDAAREACYHLKERPDILFVFISPIFEQEEAIKGIRSIAREGLLAGCSSVSSISSKGYFLGAVTVCAISSENIIFSSDVGQHTSRSARSAGNNSVKELVNLKNSDRQLCVMFTDSMSGNMADVLRGSQEALGTSFPIIGGSGTDNFQFQKTYQYFNNSILTGSVVSVLVRGNINIGTGIAHGWQPIGKPHRITRFNSNIVREIDKRPAIELYNEYLGKEQGDLNKEGIGKIGCSYPLGVNIKGRNKYLTRSPLRIENEENLVFNAEIPERDDVNIMIGDKNMALDAVKEACKEALKNIIPRDIIFAMVFSDIARLQLLRKEAHKEAEIIKEMLGENVPFFGCYTYGEYAPINHYGYSGQSYFHNQAISIAIFST
jgi:hypothetical protein